MHKKGFWVPALALLITSVLFAGDPATPNPKAPSETAEYAFMVGSWHCTSKSMKPDGTYSQPSKASWKGYFILDGWAIQDDWTRFDTEGKALLFGTNIRSYNQKLAKWECRWLPTGSLEWKHFLSWRDGDTMVMEGKGSDQRGDFIDRNTFYNIAADSWSWKKDRSYDGGKTWIEKIALIEAKRAN